MYVLIYSKVISNLEKHNSDFNLIDSVIYFPHYYQLYLIVCIM